MNIKNNLITLKNKDTLIFDDFSFKCSVGKNGLTSNKFEGDKKTPYGTYFLQKKIERELTDFYGDGAYPLNYPNKFDKFNNYTGSGIWIHGTPKSTYSRPPEASDGCIVLSNKDLVKIEHVLNTPGTPIILSNLSIMDLSLRSESDIYDEQNQLLNNIEKWKKSWEALRNGHLLKEMFLKNLKILKFHWITYLFTNTHQIKIS